MSPAPIATAPVPVPTASVPLPPLERVLTVGDGVSFDLEPAIAAALSPAVVRPRSYLGSGLSNPEHYDWATRWPEELAADGGAQLVLVLLGVWDAGDVDITIASNAVTLSPGTPQWRAWYRDLVSTAAQTLSMGGARVVWILPLSEPDPVKAARLAEVESVIVDVVSGLAGHAVLDGDVLLAGTSNQYIAAGPDDAVLRKNDGEHLCPAGAVELATGVVEVAQRWFSIAPSGGWEQGLWREDLRYSNPSDGCRQ